MDSSTQVAGLADLQAAMDRFSVDLEKKMLRGALRAAQKVVLDEAKRLCPAAPPSAENAKTYGTKSGDLQKSLRISTSAKNGVVKALLKAGNKKAFYAHMVEFGTAAHFIKPKSSKSLFIAGLMRDGVQHPGAQKKPFMRPAMDNKIPAATQAFADYLRTRIDNETAKTMPMLPDETDGVTQ